MRTPVLAAVLAGSLAAPAFAHGGSYAAPPDGGGPQGVPGLMDNSGPLTRWESWWEERGDDLLRIAERMYGLVAAPSTPSAAPKAQAPDAATIRAARAAAVRDAVVPTLLRELREDDYDVRASAAVALGKSGDPRAVLPLRELALRDQRPEVRRAALLALGILGRAEDVPFLCDVLSDRHADDDERSTAALATGLVGGDDAAAFLSFSADRVDLRTRSGADLLASIYAALGASGSRDAVPALWRAADSESLDPVLRAHAVLSLGRLRDRESIDRCVELIASAKEPQLRRAAVTTLGRTVEPRDAAAVDLLIRLLASERDQSVRRSAITALAGLRANGIRPALRERFGVTCAAGDSDRPFYALALAVQRDAVSAAAIEAALRTEREDSVRGAYATALGLLGIRTCAAALEEQLKPGTAPGLHRGYAALALGVLPNEPSREPIWKRISLEGDVRVRCDHAVALELLGDRRGRQALLAELANGAGNFEKCRAATGLGTIRCVEAIPKLAEVIAARREDGIVRALCVVALGQIADVSLTPRLQRLSSGGGATLATKALAEALTIL